MKSLSTKLWREERLVNRGREREREHLEGSHGREFSKKDGKKERIAARRKLEARS